MREVGETAVELAVGKPYTEEEFEVEDWEYKDEANAWDGPCSNDVGEIARDKARDDGVCEENNSNDDAVVGGVVAIVTDDKDCV